MNVFYEFWKIAKVLEKEKIPYALVGGVAIAFHSVPRFTKDIDILIEPCVLERIKGILKGEGYFESISPRTFKNTNLTMHRFMKIVDADEMLIDVLVSGTDRHNEIIANAVEAESAEVKVRLAIKEDFDLAKNAFVIQNKTRQILRDYKVKNPKTGFFKIHNVLIFNRLQI